MRTENLLNLKIHKLSQEQYNDALANDTIDSTALYLTPDVGDEIDTSTFYITAGQKAGTTLGYRATAEGYNTAALGAYSHAGGYGTIASGTARTAIGQYNLEDPNAFFIVGDGDGDSTNMRSNAFKVVGKTDTTQAEAYVGDRVVLTAANKFTSDDKGKLVIVGDDGNLKAEPVQIGGSF